jgi:hypothetical protein
MLFFGTDTPRSQYREKTDQILLNLSMPLCKLWSVRGLQRLILVRQCALLASTRFLERP